MVPPGWKAAQNHELEWWSSLKDRLESPETRDRKREAAEEIWREIVSIPSTIGLRRVLEVGTGGDGWVNFLPPPYRVGLEPLLLDMKRRGVGIFDPSVRFVSGVGERLPFRDDSFDVVFSYNVLDHMADPERGLDELRRVLRKDGIMHFLVDTYSLAFLLYRRFYKPDPYHPNTFTLRRIRRMLDSRGFRVVIDRSDQVPRGRRRNIKFRVFCVREK